MPVCPRCSTTHTGRGPVCTSCVARAHTQAGPLLHDSTQVMPEPTVALPISKESTKPPQRKSAPRAPTPPGVTPLPRPADADPLVGQEPLGQFRILRKLGAGGFGAVYLAEQLGVDRKAVIKVVHPRLAKDEQFVARFRREAKVLARLKHEGIVQLYAFGELPDGSLFLAMEWGGDRTLADEIARLGRLPPARALRIAEQICAALAKAHAERIVHRDLKPANVLLGSEGDPDRAMVVDLGIAKIVGGGDGDAAITQTMLGAVIGTPAYFSPEQARGVELDGRSDVYSLGVVLYEALCGARPIQAATTNEYILAHSVQAPAHPSAHGVKLPNELVALLFKALEKKPERRFAGMAELQAALERVRDRIEHPPSLLRRAAPGLIGLSLAAAGAAAVWLWPRAERPAAAKPRPAPPVVIAQAPPRDVQTAPAPAEEKIDPHGPPEPQRTEPEKPPRPEKKVVRKPRPKPPVTETAGLKKPADDPPKVADAHHVEPSVPASPGKLLVVSPGGAVRAQAADGAFFDGAKLTLPVQGSGAITFELQGGKLTVTARATVRDGEAYLGFATRPDGLIVLAGRPLRPGETVRLSAEAFELSFEVPGQRASTLMFQLKP